MKTKHAEIHLEMQIPAWMQPELFAQLVVRILKTTPRISPLFCEIKATRYEIEAVIPQDETV